MGSEEGQDEALGKLTSLVKDLVDNTDLSVTDVLSLMQQHRGATQTGMGQTWMPIKPTVTRVSNQSEHVIWVT